MQVHFDDTTSDIPSVEAVKVNELKLQNFAVAHCLPNLTFDLFHHNAKNKIGVSRVKLLHKTVNKKDTKSHIKTWNEELQKQ